MSQLFILAALWIMGVESLDISQSYLAPSPSHLILMTLVLISYFVNAVKKEITHPCCLFRVVFFIIIIEDLCVAFASWL